MRAMPDAPLDDPSYEPLHPPVNGQVPDVVAKWGPRSQVRWFWRYRFDLWEDGVIPGEIADRHFVRSVEHRGSCCLSCLQDMDMGYDDMQPHCCCIGLRADTGGS
jgi:hypothetical protein